MYNIYRYTYIYIYRYYFFYYYITITYYYGDGGARPLLQCIIIYYIIYVHCALICYGLAFFVVVRNSFCTRDCEIICTRPSHRCMPPRAGRVIPSRSLYIIIIYTTRRYDCACILCMCVCECHKISYAYRRPAANAYLMAIVYFDTIYIYTGCNRTSKQI